MYHSVGFIGTGNMGSALARAAYKGKVENSPLVLANRTPAKAQALASELGCHVCGNRELANQCDFIFLGVKPQMMADLLDDLAPVLERRAEDRPFVLVSMAAGLSMQKIRMMAGSGYPVIRMMPNTPAALGAGMIHPRVLEMAGIDPEVYSGWAFGIGLERTAMRRFKIADLRLIFENDIRFLEQF